MSRDYTDTLKVGDSAPGFTLPSSGGGEVSLAKHRGRSAVMLVFLRGTM
ncbi:MAG: redoxin domain-containing protein [Chloroflexi bacterium]|nr:redoxin domain-containing protein [Chloroflexota bacterium]